MKDAYPAIPDRLKRLGVPDSEWFIACKDGLRWLMRPGMPLKVRVSICLILYSQGYNNELAMKQVQGEASGDKALFVALTPEAIISILQKFAIEEMRRSGIELDDGQRKALRVSSPNMRACLEELEQEDGTITRVYAKEPRKLIGLTFDEAMEKRLVTPIENLSQHERKKLARRSYIVVHTHPRPATQKALTRRVDDDVLNPPSKEDKITGLLDGPKRVAFHFLKQAGKPDAKLAAKVAVRNDFQGGYQKIVQGEATRKEGLVICQRVSELAAQGSLFDDDTPMLDLSQPSAVLNPNGHGGGNEGTPSAARTADPPSPTAQGRQAGNRASTPERDQASSPAPPLDPPLVSQPRAKAPTEAEVSVVLAAMRRFCLADDDAAAQLIRACRANAPLSTITLIAEAVLAKGPLTRGAQVASKVGLLLTAVPKLFKGEAYRQLQEQETEYQRQAARAAQLQAERDRDWAQMALASKDELITEQDRAEARKILGIQEVA